MSFQEDLKKYLKDKKGEKGSHCYNCGKIVTEKVGRCPRCRCVMRHFTIGQGYQPK